MSRIVRSAAAAAVLVLVGAALAGAVAGSAARRATPWAQEVVSVSWRASASVLTSPSTREGERLVARWHGHIDGRRLHLADPDGWVPTEVAAAVMLVLLAGVGRCGRTATGRGRPRRARAPPACSCA